MFGVCPFVQSIVGAAAFAFLPPKTRTASTIHAARATCFKVRNSNNLRDSQPVKTVETMLLLTFISPPAHSYFHHGGLTCNLAVHTHYSENCTIWRGLLHSFRHTPQSADKSSSSVIPGEAKKHGPNLSQSISGAPSPSNTERDAFEFNGENCPCKVGGSPRDAGPSHSHSRGV